MYDPAGNATDRHVALVVFDETEPPVHLEAVVHRWISLHTPEPLPDDYRFHALPDACTYLVFNRRQPEICGVTKLRASSYELNLGRDFSFVNVRLLPGVWRGDTQIGLVDSPYTGDLPLPAFSEQIAAADGAALHQVVTDVVEQLMHERLIQPNPTTARIFADIDDVRTVTDMARVACLSPRQLQRVLTRTLGLAPHDFLKILRLQSTLRTGDASTYADQAHFIRSFRAATGYTPGEFARRYDV